MDRRTRSYLDRAAEAVAAGRFEEAAGYEAIAADHVRKLGDPLPERAALLDAGARRQFARGDADRAAETLSTLVEARRRLDDPSGEVDALHRLGLAHQSAHRHQDALAAFEAALAVARARFPPSFPGAAHVRAAMAVSLRRLGREADAREAAHAATEAPPATAPSEPGGAPAPAAADVEALGAVLAELDALIGLREVKARIRALAEFQRVQGMRHDAGMKAVRVSQHLAFTGSPGTGKTTIARLYGRALHALGILATDKLVETSRAQLVAGFVGQTAGKVDAVVDSALDGVLFVDEAYALTESGSAEDFGAEAVTQLLTRMENDRDRLAVVFAGYSRPMARFLASNPGLESRVGEVIEFPDYEPAELLAIFGVFAGRADYALSEPAAERLQAALEELHSARDDSFGNARLVRNLFEDAIVAQASRLVEAGACEPEDLRTLEPADVDAALSQHR